MLKSNRSTSLFLTLIICLLGLCSTSANAAMPTGKYSCALSRNTSGLTTNLSSTSGVGIAFSIYLDLDNMQMGMSFVKVNNYNLQNASAAVVDGLIPITIVPNSTLNNYNSYIVRLTDSGNNNQTTDFQLMPVNSGNTLFVMTRPDSQNNFMATGVCNKI